MIYNYIKDIDLTDRFCFIVIILVIATFTHRIQISWHILIGIIVGLLIVYYLNEKNIDEGTNFLTDMKSILSLPMLKTHINKHLYYDSELLQFLYNNKENYKYNPVVYNTLVKQIDVFLSLVKDIEIGKEKINMDYEVLREYKINILNTYHSFIHTVPHTDASNASFHISIKNLENLLNYHIDKSHSTVVAKNNKEITIDTKFPYRNGPTGFDSRNSPNYNFF